MSSQPQNLKFVDREKEILLFKGLLIELKENNRIGYPIREYLGKPGIGKTALLQTLYDETKQAGFPVALVDFEKLQRDNVVYLSWLVFDSIVEQFFEENFDLKQSLKKTIADALSDFETEKTAPLIPRKQLEAFFDACKKISGVIFLDTVNLAPLDSLDYIATEIIAPLTDSRSTGDGQILLVTGSKERVNWGAAKYKLWRRTESTLLRDLDIDEIAEIAEGTVFENVTDDLFRITSGNPLSVHVAINAVSGIRGLERRRLSKDEFGDFEMRLVEAIVDKTVRGKTIADDALDSFKVLSAFRIFDVDLPVDILLEADPAIDISDPSAGIKLIQRIREQVPDYVVQLEEQANSYRMDQGIRRTLSLYMRLFEPNYYLDLCKKAKEYYQIKFESTVQSKKFESTVAPTLLVEILFNKINEIKLETPKKSDLEIALEIRKEFISGLDFVVRESSKTLDAKLEFYDRLRRLLEKDFELNELLGDQSELQKSFLIQILDESREKAFQPGKGELLILQNHPGKKAQKKAQFKYTVSFHAPDTEVTEVIGVSAEDERELAKTFEETLLISDLAALGKTLYAQYFPTRIQELLSNHRGPLLVRTNNPYIPWELLHDASGFLALRTPIGKFEMTLETSRLGRRIKDEKKKALIIGVPETEVKGYGKLDYVENEIEVVESTLRSLQNLDVVVVRDKQATSQKFVQLLNSGFSIIHFAGHAYFKETDPYSGGLVLYNNIVPLANIKRCMLDGSLVLINACQSAAGKTVESNVGYVGAFTTGIASAFMLSGALCCIGNIWKVLDKESAIFASLFYNELFTNISVGEALMKAKIKFSNQEPNDKTWTSYVLYGDPTLRIELPS